MKRLIAISLVLLSVSAVRSEEIPLDQIWGYQMPGTRDIAGIPFPENPEGVGNTFTMLSKQRDHNIEHIRSFLASKPPGEPAQPGFVFQEPVNSRILRALPSPMRKKNPFQRDAYSGDLTLVFFSHPLSYFARLRKVEREGKQITVHYQFEPHTTPEATVHFALIPLGELPAGEYRVTYKQIPIDGKYRELGFEPVSPYATEIVCRDFSFVVKADSEETPKTESLGDFIPLHEVWGYNMPGTRKVGELDAVKEPTGVTEHPIVNQIHRILSSWRPKEGESAGPVFIVEGTGKEALENAQAVFTKAAEPTKAVPPDTDLSLVFFSHIGGRYARIVSVDKSEQAIEVKYQFVTHTTAESTVHFALIPIGKLSREKFDVKITELPSVDSRGRPVTPIANLDRIVCQGTSFRVQKGD